MPLPMELKVRKMCMNFLKKTWLDLLTMRSFEEEHMRALSVTVTAITEVLAKIEKGDGIDSAIKL
jgi:hypothetical protein